MEAHEEMIYGLHAVAEAIRAGEPISRLVVGANRRRDPKVAPLLSDAHARGIAVSFESDGAVFRGAPGDRHQHVAAVVRPFAYTPFGEIRARVRAGKSALVVIVDHLEDPHNLGAVMRNAEGAGADAVIMPDRRNASVTAVTRRAAAGAASHLAIARVANVAATLEALKADGCWVAGLSLVPQAIDYRLADYGDKAAIVVGAEGKGLSRLVGERCDLLVRIPLHGQVASLNAASAAAVVLFEVARRRVVKGPFTATPRASEAKTPSNP
ncbi:MAG: 23S rRNA (guanosine(2251)-2'-O)-methyltransferase RlmB [Candidatus Eremiobacter antarcticus]|nr:23S rRNA (guanosine(2251)-2'-O)-methyltransferase RlmB [Candidatus Eremiobacteraeota bacterium]MBC5808648.1 23S rRNA (guanosine(2251)-2'-O)-methyltransferase RlmB [Candidatus Eremiobacteraeota bacterium]PZR62140.1 MAG: 23S rRNA (guanosine(2251)-2'-O)-methyltransferase RlmB [Candidatus Eremiobacter sp. RRmetagenome_bin22]